MAHEHVLRVKCFVELLAIDISDIEYLQYSVDQSL